MKLPRPSLPSRQTLGALLAGFVLALLAVFTVYFAIKGIIWVERAYDLAEMLLQARLHARTYYVDDYLLNQLGLLIDIAVRLLITLVYWSLAYTTFRWLRSLLTKKPTAAQARR